MDKKHVASIYLKVDVYDLLENGEVSGKSLSVEELKEFDLKKEYLLLVSGNSKEECINLLKRKINEFKSR